jgi:hypothetical protein
LEFCACSSLSGEMWPASSSRLAYNWTDKALQTQLRVSKTYTLFLLLHYGRKRDERDIFNMRATSSLKFSQTLYKQVNVKFMSRRCERGSVRSKASNFLLLLLLLLQKRRILQLFANINYGFNAFIKIRFVTMIYGKGK